MDAKNYKSVERRNPASSAKRTDIRQVSDEDDALNSMSFKSESLESITGWACKSCKRSLNDAPTAIFLFE